MLKLNYFLADIFILSAEKQPIKLSWRKIEWLQDIMPGKSPNAGYLHLLQQVRLYYPDGAGKLQEMIENDKEHWRVAIHAAVKNGELRKDIDVENVILLYHHVFMGMSYEMSLFNGLDTDLLYSSFMCLYDALKQ